MKFALVVENLAKRKILTKLAKKAEDLGFDAYLLTDHYMLPFTNRLFDPWIFLSSLAPQTESIRLGTCVSPLTFRRPAVLAKAVATLDVLSEGRTILGAGAGWYRPEFEGFSRWLDTRDRVSAFRESLELVLELWTGNPVTYRGKYVSAVGAVVDPPPVQRPHPEVWVGSHSSYTLKLTGQYGNGWIPIGPRWGGGGLNLEEYGRKASAITDACKDCERMDDFTTFTCLMGSGPLEEMEKDMERYRKNGLNYFTLGLERPREEDLITLEEFHDEIISTHRS